MSKKIYQLLLDVEVNVDHQQLDDITLALSRIISNGVVKGGFKINEIDQTQDYQRVNTPVVNNPTYNEENRRTISRARVGEKQVKDYILEFMLNVGEATSEEAGVYLANESARYQRIPFSATSASPALSVLGKFGVLIKPLSKTGKWKLNTDISHELAREIVNTSDFYKRKQKASV